MVLREYIRDILTVITNEKMRSTIVPDAEDETRERERDLRSALNEGTYPIGW